MKRSQRDRTQLFISYSHADTEWLKRLQVHLKPLEREGKLERWDDTMIRPGTKWREAIDEAVASAKVAVLLVSADFLASDFIASDELPPLLAAAEQDGAIILPVILSPSRFENIPGLVQFQSVNSPSQPLIGLPKVEQEAVLVRLADTIEQALHSPVSVSERQREAPTDLENTPSTSYRVPTGAKVVSKFDVIGWLRQNKEWVFSGIGVAVLAAILGWIFSLSEREPATPPPTVKANGGVAAGGNIEGSRITITGSGEKTAPSTPGAED